VYSSSGKMKEVGKEEEGFYLLLRQLTKGTVNTRESAFSVAQVYTTV